MVVYLSNIKVTLTSSPFGAGLTEFEIMLLLSVKRRGLEPEKKQGLHDAALATLIYEKHG